MAIRVFKTVGKNVTVEGLSAGAIKSGTTVTVKQGSKVVQQVTGTLTIDDFIATLTKTSVSGSSTSYKKSHTITVSAPSGHPNTVILDLMVTISNYGATLSSSGTCTIKSGSTTIGSSKFSRGSRSGTTLHMLFPVRPSSGKRSFTISVSSSDNEVVSVSGFVMSY